MSERGQASVEHATVVLVVIAVLGGAGGLIGGWTPGIVNAIHSGIRRAICVAGGDRCAAFHDERPCVIAREEQRQVRAVSVAVVRVGASVGLVRERRSDGSEKVTWYDDLGGGMTVGVGAEWGQRRDAQGESALLPAVSGRSRRGPGGRGSPRSASRESGLTLAATAKVMANAGWGRSWELADGAEADRLVHALLGGRKAPAVRQVVGHGVDALIARRVVPPPDQDRLRLRSAVEAGATLKGPGGLQAGADLFRRLEGEASRDRRTGRLTVAIGLEAGLAARVLGPAALDVRGEVEASTTATITLDRDRRPLMLQMGASVGDGGTRRRELELRLDLTHPEVAATLGGMLDAMLAGRLEESADRAEALGRWVVTEGAIEQREYAVAREQRERKRSLAAGVKFGYEAADMSSGWRLVRARTKPPGGIWETRISCGAAT